MKPPNLLDTIKTKLRLFLSIPETENTFLIGTRSLTETERDRPAYTREEVQAQCLDAWRFNPLARRVVELTTQFTVGNGFTLSCEDERTLAFINEFWDHRLNQMDNRVLGISDELSRAGNLFLLISTDPEQETLFKVKENLDQDFEERETTSSEHSPVGASWVSGNAATRVQNSSEFCAALFPQVLLQRYNYFNESFCSPYLVWSP